MYPQDDIYEGQNTERLIAGRAWEALSAADAVADPDEALAPLRSLERAPQPLERLRALRRIGAERIAQRDLSGW